MKLDFFVFFDGGCNILVSSEIHCQMQDQKDLSLAFLLICLFQ